MKVAIFVCVALLAVLLQAKHEMAPPAIPDGTRVANGKPAGPRQFPYMAYIEPSDDSGEPDMWCSGSLITRSAVLTSAYCVYFNTTMYKVRLGSIYRTAEDTNAWTIVSTWALIHPSYNHENMDNNIAIIYLPKLAPLNEFIQPVHLPRSPNASSYIGCEGIFSGWGETSPGSELSDVLRWAELVVVPNAICKKFAPAFALTDRQLCAGSYTTTVYRYDIGAPVVLNTTGRYIQVGIESTRTTPEYNTSHPVIFTRVTSFVDWIQLNTKSD